MKRLAALVLALVALLPAPLLADSARKMPLSYNVATFGGPGRDYTTLQAWEDATDNDLVAAGKGEVLLCYPDSAAYAQRVTISGAVTNASYFRVIRAAPGFERQVVLDYNGVLGSYDGTVLVTNENHVGLYDLSIRHHISTSASVNTKDIFIQGNTAGACRVVGCRLGPSVNTGSDMASAGQVYGDGRLVVADSVVAAYPEGYGIIQNNGQLYVLSSVFYGVNQTALYSQAATSIAVNCVLQGNGANFYGAAWLITTCKTDGTVSFVNAAAGDFHLSDTDASAKDHGTDLSSDAIFPFSDDMDGDLRPQGAAWDIGADEWKPGTAGMVTIPLF